MNTCTDCNQLVRYCECGLFSRHEAATTSESAEPKAKAERAAEDRADNPGSPDRSASSGGGLMAPWQSKPQQQWAADMHYWMK